MVFRSTLVTTSAFCQGHINFTFGIGGCDTGSRGIVGGRPFLLGVDFELVLTSWNPFHHCHCNPHHPQGNQTAPLQNLGFTHEAEA